MSEYAGIYLLDNPYFLDASFDYFLPPDLRNSIHVGDLVTVPFGTSNRRVVGLVAALKDSPDDPNLSCKPVLSVFDRSMSLSEEMFGLCFFIKDRTLCTVGDAVRAAIPASAISHLEEIYRPTDNSNEDASLDASTLFILNHIRKKGYVTIGSLKTKFGPALDGALKKLLSQKLVEKDFMLHSTGEKKRKSVFTRTLEGANACDT